MKVFKKIDELKLAPAEAKLQKPHRLTLTKYNDSVKGIIVVKNNYLLQLRDNKKNIYFPNFWGVFGGRVEKAETYRKAIKREIREETNLIVRVSRMILSVNYKMIGLKKKPNIVYYECGISEKRKIILTEGQKYKFFSFKQIKKLNIIPMDFAAIKIHYLKIIKKKVKNQV